jgi:sRNA-binding carbon storage regulator CsrA
MNEEEYPIEIDRVGFVLARYLGEGIMLNVNGEIVLVYIRRVRGKEVRIGVIGDNDRVKIGRMRATGKYAP